MTMKKQQKKQGPSILPPPKYPVRAEEALRMFAMLPKIEREPGESDSEWRKRWRSQVRSRALSMRDLYGLTFWSAGREFVYDADEIERIKSTRWEARRAS